ncbi:MAG: AraC family transcriptional regulator [Victivallaceae bacterium]|jgi:AraC-like DNA-binding protein
MRRIISRTDPNKLPPLPLPLYVRSVGYNEAENAWTEFFPAETKKFVQIFWGVRGEGEFRIGDSSYVLHCNEVIYHLPGEDHFHKSQSPVWAYHWFTLDGPLAVAFIQGFGYSREVMPAGRCPVDLFLQLETLMREMSPYSQRKMLSVAVDILALAGSRDDSKNSCGQVVSHFIELVQENYSNPSVNINELSDQLKIHRTTLTRLFKKRMLVSPGEYLLQLRLQRALSLLRETDYPVYEIGEMVGIPHRGYFCRLIRRTVGVSPGVYREQLSMI